MVQTNMDIDVEEYKRFLGIDYFPNFEVKPLQLDLSQQACAFAKTEYDCKAKQHTLYIPTICELPRYVIYHELTHILDAEEYSNGNSEHDYCLNGYLEYHAAQVSMMQMLGATSVCEQISFGMDDLISDCSVKEFLEKKYRLAVSLMKDSDKSKKVDGLDVFFGYLGFASICKLFANDYSDRSEYREAFAFFPLTLFYEIRETMVGWKLDVEYAVILYSHAYNSLIT